jgi:hypothetical protein
MEDVDKLDNIQDGFMHYQLIRFCQATQLHYINGHVQLANQNVLQQHVDHKITNAFLKKGTRDAYKAWNQQDCAWVDMRLHESHDEGGFGVPTTPSPDARPRTRPTPGLLPSWAPLPAMLNRSGCRATTSRIQPPRCPPPLCQLKQMHEDLLQHYDCTDQPAAAQPAPAVWCRRQRCFNAGANLQPQPAGTQDNGHGNLVLPQLNRLLEAFKRRQVSHPASSSSQDQQPTRRPSPIPAVFRRNVSHAAAHPALAPIQGLASALR